VPGEAEDVKFQKHEDVVVVGNNPFFLRLGRNDFERSAAHIEADVYRDGTFFSTLVSVCRSIRSRYAPTLIVERISSYQSAILEIDRRNEKMPWRRCGSASQGVLAL
jgi:hypothetical protein